MIDIEIEMRFTVSIFVEDTTGFVIIELDFFTEHFENVIFRKSLKIEKKLRDKIEIIPLLEL